MTAFDDAWEVVKGDFFFDNRTPGSRDPRPDLKGLRRAVKSGHKWLNNPKTRKRLLNQARRSNRYGQSEFATMVPHWEKGKPTPKGFKPWRAVNLSAYGRKLPGGMKGKPRIGAIRSRGIGGEEDLIDDIIDQDIHETMHEATEYALMEGGANPKNPVPFEIAAITGETGRQNRKPGIIDRFMRRDPRKTGFNRGIERHRDTHGKKIPRRFAEAKKRRMQEAKRR